MISRRLVRVKTLQGLYSWKQSNSDDLNRALHAHVQSLQSTYDIFLHTLEFPARLTDYLLAEADKEKQKYYPDKEAIRQFEKLSHSPLIGSLNKAAGSVKRVVFADSWDSETESIKRIYQELKALDFYADYCIFDAPIFAQQQQFLEELFTYLIDESELFNNIMEEQYPKWQEDAPLVLRETLRMLSQTKDLEGLKLPSRADKNSEDMEFGVKLFESVVINDTIYEDKIAAITENWDPARIAVIDLIAIKMAMAEFLRFPNIPTKVTINEYLEIIKNYSTPNSSRFLNGILDKLRLRLDESGEIQKSGRGLRDN